MGNGVYFKRWTRKSYSAFNSLKKEIRICILDFHLKLLSPVHKSEFYSCFTLNITNKEEQEKASLLDFDFITNTILKEFFLQTISNKFEERFSYRYLIFINEH